MNLKREVKQIECDAEFAFDECKKRAEDNCLELDYVISEFLKAFNRFTKDFQ